MRERGGGGRRSINLNWAALEEEGVEGGAFPPPLLIFYEGAAAAESSFRKGKGSLRKVSKTPPPFSTLCTRGETTTPPPSVPAGPLRAKKRVE